MIASALALMTVAHGCQCDYRAVKFAADGGTPGDAGDGGLGGDTGSLAEGNFWNIYSGIAYADAGGEILHAVVGEGPVGNLDLGDLSVIQVSPPDIAPLTEDHLAYINGVVISPAPPERLLFLDGFTGQAETGLGILMMSDLSAARLPGVMPSTVQLTNSGTVSGQGVRPFSYFFGQNGNEILMIDDYNPQTTTGTLVWTNGNGTFRIIGTGATPQALVLSADLSHAVAAIHVGATAVSDGGTVDPDLGDLVWIDLSNGSTTPVASTVTALPHEHYCPPALCDGTDAGQNVCGDGCACVSNIPSVDAGFYGNTGPEFYCACAVPPSCSYLNQSPEPMFSVSATGQSVAYESPAGGDGSYSVSVATLGDTGPQTTQIGEGQFPAVSGDGSLVAFFNPSANAGAGALEIQDSTGNLIATTPAQGSALPRFSPDGQIVAYPQNYSVRGEALSGEIADVWLMETTASATPVAYATNAAWDSLTFWPASGATSQVSVLAQLADPSGVVTLTNGSGNLQVDDPASLFASGAASAPVAFNLNPLDFGLLPASGGFALSDNGSLGCWLPDSTSVRRPGTFDDLRNPIAYGTLQTSAVVAGLDADEITFLTSMATSSSYSEPPGPLWGGSPSQVQHLKDNVTRTALTPDGRVLALVQVNATLTEVWLLPLNGSN